MKVIATYPFQATPGMSQLSFPAGAIIEPRSGPNEAGWMYGSYQGKRGWFPKSYVEIPPQQPAPTQQRRVKYTNTLADINELPSMSPSFEQTHKNTDNDNDNDDDGFGMMGGSPGDLFDGAPKPYYTTTQQQRSDSPSFLKDKPEQEEEAPVDIYRHAPPRNRNYAEDYSSTPSVQVTSAPTTPPQTTKVVQVDTSPTSTSEFWKAHPGRVAGPSAEQATELEKAFKDLKDSDTIEIKVEEHKKKRFPFLPKSIKRAAQKTVHAVTHH